MIPKLHYISQGNNSETHLENIKNACVLGAALVQLRLKNVSDKEILKTALEARKITHHFQTKLIINDHYKIAKEVQADGVHLGKKDICITIARKYLYPWQVIGGTANCLEDCEILIRKKVDYIGLGPFRFTSTKENLDPILGINGYKTIIESLKTETPILAIGGITLKDVTDLIKTGIFGIAVSGYISQDFSRIKTFNDLLSTASTQEQRHRFK